MMAGPKTGDYGIMECVLLAVDKAKCSMRLLTGVWKRANVVMPKVLLVIRSSDSFQRKH